ncbi:MAG: hypothetical protein NC254_11680 [bacterium]|nr:hypothetical protein [bacterium]
MKNKITTAVGAIAAALCFLTVFFGCTTEAYAESGQLTHRHTGSRESGGGCYGTCKSETWDCNSYNVSVAFSGAAYIYTCGQCGTRWSGQFKVDGVRCSGKGTTTYYEISCGKGGAAAVSFSCGKSTQDWAKELDLNASYSVHEGGISISGFLWNGVSGGSSLHVTENGTYTLGLSGSGNVDFSPTISITVDHIDHIPPAISSFQASSDVWGKSVELVAAASDAESGLAAEAYSFDGGATWSASNIYTVTENGTYAVSVRDAVGNISTAETTVTKVDTAPPTVSLSTSPSVDNWYDGGLTVTVQAQDNEGGLSDAPYSFDGGVTYSAGNSAVLSGSGTLEIAVKDLAGNVTRVSFQAEKKQRPQPTSAPGGSAGGAAGSGNGGGTTGTGNGGNAGGTGGTGGSGNPMGSAGAGAGSIGSIGAGIDETGTPGVGGTGTDKAEGTGLGAGGTDAGVNGSASNGTDGTGNAGSETGNRGAGVSGISGGTGNSGKGQNAQSDRNAGGGTGKGTGTGRNGDDSNGTGADGGTGLKNGKNGWGGRYGSNGSSGGVAQSEATGTLPQHYPGGLPRVGSMIRDWQSGNESEDGNGSVYGAGTMDGNGSLYGNDGSGSPDENRDENSGAENTDENGGIYEENTIIQNERFTSANEQEAAVLQKAGGNGGAWADVQYGGAPLLAVCVILFAAALLCGWVLLFGVRVDTRDEKGRYRFAGITCVTKKEQERLRVVPLTKQIIRRSHTNELRIRLGLLDRRRYGGETLLLRYRSIRREFKAARTVELHIRA